jgi:hypothetical protein
LRPNSYEEAIQDIAETLTNYDQTLTYEVDEEVNNPLSYSYITLRIAQVEEWDSEELGYVFEDCHFSFLLTEYFSASSRANRWLLFNLINSGFERRLYISLLPPQVDPGKLYITDDFIRGWDTDDASIGLFFDNTLSSRASVITQKSVVNT